MSNQLRRTSKGDKAPSVRRNEFNNTIRELEQKIYQLHMALLETNYIARSTSAGVFNLVEFLTKKGIVVEKEYKEFLEEQKKKSQLAEEIRKDEGLNREEKIAKAKKNKIPEDWVVDPEPEEAPQTEEPPVAEEAGA